MFMSSTRWVALRLELMTNLVTLVVALFLVFGLSSAPHSYKAMALSLVLQVRDGLSDSRGAGRRLVVVCGLWADLGVCGTLITPWVLAICDLTKEILFHLQEIGEHLKERIAKDVSELKSLWSACRSEY